MLNTAQAEIAKDLLTARDITIIGVLLAIIVVLIYYINLKDKKIEARETYIREQDKETLKILLELTNTLKDKQEHDKEVKVGVTNIKETVTDSNSKLNNLYSVIQQKLLGMGK
ncbi:hypothetical protein [uncultured Winogradskyella sp.]|uniref:hypothetical protein n=1 Tax=uncultured Winogradskyella sp. TaxID=395353 RepID=UPI00260C2637|nr:hypothetical protein [uncultured Winogradskyella sp.]